MPSRLGIGIGIGGLGSSPLLVFLIIAVAFSNFLKAQPDPQQPEDQQQPQDQQPQPPPPAVTIAATSTMLPPPRVFHVPVVLKACCGTECEEFSRPEEMYGVTCCGYDPINQFEEICCDGVVRRRRQSNGFIDRCCGNQTLAYDQTCCNGVVHNIPSAECCGRMAYPRNNFNTLCCDENLLTNVEPSLTCCGKNAYDGGKREICCGGQVVLKEQLDGCCALYVPGRNTTTQYQAYNTRMQQCCDKPIERYGNTKCCYLKDAKTGSFFPSSYDSSTQCCAFPFTAISQKNPDGTCTPSAAAQTALTTIAPNAASPAPVP